LKGIDFDQWFGCIEWAFMNRPKQTNGTPAALIRAVG
jgi:hypothetical protein